MIFSKILEVVLFFYSILVKYEQLFNLCVQSYTWPSIRQIVGEESRNI